MRLYLVMYCISIILCIILIALFKKMFGILFSIWYIEGIVQPDQIGSRMVPFKFFKFDLKFLKGVKSFNVLNTQIYLILPMGLDEFG